MSGTAAPPTPFKAVFTNPVYTYRRRAPSGVVALAGGALGGAADGAVTGGVATTGGVTVGGTGGGGG